jgi:hypothetical protein
VANSPPSSALLPVRAGLYAPQACSVPPCAARLLDLAARTFHTQAAWRRHVQSHVAGQGEEAYEHLPFMAAAAGGRYCPLGRRLTFSGKGALVKDRTKSFARLVCDPGAPCRSHENPAVTPSVQQATRARRATRHQDRLDQLVAEKERRTVGPSPLFPRPAMENLLTAPLWSRHVFGKMPQTCRVAYRSLLIEHLWTL